MSNLDIHAKSVCLLQMQEFSHILILIPNNIDQIGNVKILNAKILYNTSPWQLQLEIYIDGAVYYKKVNLSD